MSFITKKRKKVDLEDENIFENVEVRSTRLVFIPIYNALFNY